MREGTTTFSMVGSTRDPVTGEDSQDDYRKYYVHVTKENEQLKLTVEESEEEEDILPTEVQLLSGKRASEKDFTRHSGRRNHSTGSETQYM